MIYESKLGYFFLTLFTTLYFHNFIRGLLKDYKHLFLKFRYIIILLSIQEEYFLQNINKYTVLTKIIRVFFFLIIIIFKISS
jgi:hypothetical protein